MMGYRVCFFFFSSRRRHTRYIGDWSSDVCSSDLKLRVGLGRYRHRSQFSPTNCGEQHLDNDRSLDKRWKLRAAPTKSLALCHPGPTSWITTPGLVGPPASSEYGPATAEPSPLTPRRTEKRVSP